jgi:hypothetical protein
LPQSVDFPKLLDRFWGHVKIGDDCWLWNSSKRPKGYGYFTIYVEGQEVRFYAHRFAYTSIYGPIENRLYVLHRCDVPLCCRPDHLFLGTLRENSHDMMQKGRWRGRTPPQLTADQVRAIRARLATGAGPRTIAREFGIHRDKVRDIRLGRAYAWVPAMDPSAGDRVFITGNPSPAL